MNLLSGSGYSPLYPIPHSQKQNVEVSGLAVEDTGRCCLLRIPGTLQGRRRACPSPMQRATAPFLADDFCVAAVGCAVVRAVRPHSPRQSPLCIHPPPHRHRRQPCKAIPQGQKGERAFTRYHGTSCVSTITKDHAAPPSSQLIINSLTHPFTNKQSGFGGNCLMHRTKTKGWFRLRGHPARIEI